VQHRRSDDEQRNRVGDEVTESAVEQWGDEYPGQSRELAWLDAESLQIQIERHVERLNDPQQDDESQREPHGGAEVGSALRRAGVRRVGNPDLPRYRA
jgi:hypothetical protein